MYAPPPASAAGSELRPEGRASRRRRRHTISDDDRGSPQTPGAGSAVGLGRRSVGLEPHESPTTPPHRRDGRTRCRPMQAAASTAPAILAAARRHAPARKRGYRRRSRAACVVIRAAPGPLFDVTAAPGAGRCAPDPRVTMMARSITVERSVPASCFGLARVSGLGMGMGMGMGKYLVSGL